MFEEASLDYLAGRISEEEFFTFLNACCLHFEEARLDYLAGRLSEAEFLARVGHRREEAKLIIRGKKWHEAHP